MDRLRQTKLICATVVFCVSLFCFMLSGLSAGHDIFPVVTLIMIGAGLWIVDQNLENGFLSLFHRLMGKEKHSQKENQQTP